MLHKTTTWAAAFCLSVVLLAQPGYPRAAEPTVTARDGWRRTAQGWEHRRRWTLPSDNRIAAVAAVHPLLVGTLELLLSIGALQLFAAPACRTPDSRTGPVTRR